MLRRQAKQTMQGTLTLLLVRIRGLHAAADAMEPLAFTDLLGEIVLTCETIVARSGGHVAEVDVADVEGSRILSAWVEGVGDSEVDPIDVAHALASAVRDLLARRVPPTTNSTPVAVALHRGECVYSVSRGEVCDILGAVVNRLHEILRQAPDDRDAILLDESLVGEAGVAGLRDLGVGVYAVSSWTA